MIHISSKGYNIGSVEVDTKLVASQSVTIGDKRDFGVLLSFAESGIMRVKATVTIGGSDLDFDGCVTCNLFGLNYGTPGVEFSTIVFASDSQTGGAPIIVGGQFYMDDDNLVCHLTATTVS